MIELKEIEPYRFYRYLLETDTLNYPYYTPPKTTDAPGYFYIPATDTPDLYAPEDQFTVRPTRIIWRL